MPSTDILSIIILYLPCVFIHELGHAIGARFVGIHVFTCGIGYGKPILNIRFLDTHFYVAFHGMLGGTTICKFDSSHVVSRKLWMIIGGPLANILLVSLSLIGLSYTSSPFLGALFYINTYLFIVTILPFSSKYQSTELPSDGLTALNLLHPENDRFLLKSQVACLELMHSTCKDLKCWDGVIYFTLILAEFYLLEEKMSKVEEMLTEEYLQDPRRGSLGVQQELQIRTTFEYLQNPEDQELWMRAFAICNDNDQLKLVLVYFCVKLEVYNQEIIDLIYLWLQEAKEKNSEFIEHSLEALLLLIDTPNNLFEKYNEAYPILQKVIPEIALDVTIFVIIKLVEQGLLEEASQVFTIAHILLQKYAQERISEERIASVQFYREELNNIVEQTQLSETPELSQLNEIANSNNAVTKEQIRNPERGFQVATMILTIIGISLIARLSSAFLETPQSLTQMLFFAIFVPSIALFFSIPILRDTFDKKSFCTNLIILACAICFAFFIPR